MKYLTESLFVLQLLLVHFDLLSQAADNNTNDLDDAFLTEFQNRFVETLKDFQESLDRDHMAEAETESRLNYLEDKMTDLLDESEMKGKQISYLENQIADRIDSTENHTNELIGSLNSSFIGQISSLSHKIDEIPGTLNKSLDGQTSELMKRHELTDNIIRILNYTMIGEMKRQLSYVASAQDPPPSFKHNLDCCDLRAAGVKTTRNYRIRVNGTYIDVRCDMITEGGGWTVIQRRSLTGIIGVNFTRGWVEYEDGFGIVPQQYWIGLTHIAELTKNRDQEIRFDMESFNVRKGKAYAKYGNFYVSGPEDKYRLSIGNYSGTAGDSMRYYGSGHDGMQFSTSESDSDKWTGNCAEKYKSGWWYNACLAAHPNGILYSTETNNWNSVCWGQFHSSNSLKFMEMKIRNKNPALCGL